MIKVYSKPGCGQCFMAKRHLTSKGVEFEEINTAQDEAAFTFLKEQNISSLPVIDINGELLVGFVPEKINELLEVGVMA